MKIIHVSPKLSASSVNLYAADLACKQRQNGIASIVVSPTNDIVGSLAANGVRHVPCRKENVLSMLAEANRLNKLICSFLPDIVQVYTPGAAWRAWLACRYLPSHIRPRLVAVISSLMRGRFSLWALKRMDAFVTISNYLRTQLEHSRILLAAQKAWVIPYGVDTTQLSPSYRPSLDWQEQWESAQRPVEGQLSLCLPGAITPIHGLDQLPGLLRLLRENGIEPHAYIVGDTRRADRSFLSAIRNRIAEAGVEQNITWLSLRPDLRDVLCACDITLSLAKYPATYDRPILEALALGRPVAGFDHGVVGELLSAFLPEGRVQPDDLGAMADTLTQWHTYRPETQSSIPYPYTMDNTAGNFNELYRQLLSLDARPRR